jgi:hypothetical protein
METYESNVIEEELQQFELTDCGASYLNELVQPYLSAIDGVIDETLLKDWVKEYLPSEIETLGPQMEGLDAEAIKQVICSHLMMKIAIATQNNFSKGHLYTGAPKRMCTPWDILRDGTKDPEVAKLFFASIEATLPVIITIDGNSHVHMVTEEVITGLLLYCAVSKYEVNLSMCGLPFSQEFIEVLLDRALHDNDDATYVMTLSDERKISFSEPEFLQWFLTGALWNKKDQANKYWKEIYSRSYNCLVTF